MSTTIRGYQHEQVTCVIIGLEKGQRDIVGSRSLPPGFDLVEQDRVLLDYTLAQLEQVGLSSVIFLGSHQLGKLIGRFPNLRSFPVESDTAGKRLVFPEIWLGKVLLLLRADYFYADSFMRNLQAIDEPVIHAYAKSTSGAREFAAALIRFTDQPADVSKVPYQGNVTNGAFMNALVDSLTSGPVAEYDVSSTCAHVHDESRLQQLVFPGKAQTLDQLRSLLEHSRVPDSVRFAAQQWTTEPGIILSRIREAFPEQELAIRSSATGEDGSKASGAGYFQSVIGVSSSNTGSLRSAIDVVAESFSRDQRRSNANDEILVQPRIVNLQESGVVLTRSLRTGGPYFTVSRSLDNHRTDVITSGDQGFIETLVVAHSVSRELVTKSDWNLIQAVRELCTLTMTSAVDIEYCITLDGQVWILQVRPMTVLRERVIPDRNLLQVLVDGAEVLKLRQVPVRGVAGGGTILANMSDWNPVEMLGISPSPLALSLYQELIGADAWSKARRDLGYRDITGHQLIVDVFGKAYVDVRLSINSFIPEGLPLRAAELWVQDCLRRLTSEPDLQDKIEFSILPTTFDLDWPKWADAMRRAGLVRGDIETYELNLRALTQDALVNGPRLVEEAEAQVRRLERLTWQKVETEKLNVLQLRGVLREAVRECVMFGTRPFALVARLAFMAIQLLRSAVSQGSISREDFEAVLRSIPSVGTRFSEDLRAYSEGEIHYEFLLQRYGHLRPQSYEINSPPYRAGVLKFLAESSLTKPNGLGTALAGLARETGDIAWSGLIRDLSGLGIAVTQEQMTAFVRDTVRAREELKFAFTGTLDFILEVTRALAAQYGIDTQDAEFVTIGEYLGDEMPYGLAVSQEHFRKQIAFRRKAQDYGNLMQLPDVIGDSSALFVHRLSSMKPTFPVRKTVQGTVVRLSADSSMESLGGKIVAIQAADPGFDWIFMQGIGGLLTEYGGLASHMAIRCAELGIPAAIGCGGEIFGLLAEGQTVLIDGIQERVELL